MKLDQVLTEGRDAPLYHVTTLPRLLYALERNELRAYQTDIDLVSLTRNKRLRHIAGKGPAEGMLIFDQRKLSYNYKMEPQNDNPEDKMDMMDDSREDEEVVVGSIKPLNRYVDHIVIFDHYKDLEEVPRITDLAEDLHIPVRFE